MILIFPLSDPNSDGQLAEKWRLKDVLGEIVAGELRRRLKQRRP